MDQSAKAFISYTFVDIIKSNIKGRLQSNVIRLDETVYKITTFIYIGGFSVMN